MGFLNINIDLNRWIIKASKGLCKRDVVCFFAGVIATVTVFILLMNFSPEHFQKRVMFDVDSRNQFSNITSKSEDLREISEQLGELSAQVNGIKTIVDKKLISDFRQMICGVNNYELNDWEISVSGKNSLGLNAGDEVDIINAASGRRQSARFRVAFIRENTETNDIEIYMNEASAQMLGISQPGIVGRFQLNVEKAIK